MVDMTEDKANYRTFYMPPHMEPDNCENYVVMQPTVEAILPKANYEARLRADMVAILTELLEEIEKQSKIPNSYASAYDWNNGVYACYKVIQQKINSLKENING